MNVQQITILELIKKELYQIFPSILCNEKAELNAQDIIDAHNSEIIEELNLIKGEKGINKNELKM